MSGRGEPIAGADDVRIPLRERMPEYLAVFGVGFAAAVVIGIVFGLVSAAGVGTAVGYTIILLGVVFLLAGGASGGGYTNMSMGAVGSLFGGRGRIDEDVSDPEARRGALPRMDPQERLRRGLRPEANPRAFWQVIGGFAYLAAGLFVLELFG